MPAPEPATARIRLAGREVEVPVADRAALLSFVGASEDLDGLLQSTMRKCWGRPTPMNSRELAMGTFLLRNWEAASPAVPQLGPHVRGLMHAQVQRQQHQRQQHRHLHQLAVQVCAQLVESAFMSTHESQLLAAVQPLVSTTMATPGVPLRVQQLLQQVLAWVQADQPVPEGEDAVLLWEHVYAPIVFPFLVDEHNDAEQLVRRAQRRLQVLLRLFAPQNEVMSQ